jgi:hypothetical protein
MRRLVILRLVSAGLFARLEEDIGREGLKTGLIGPSRRRGLPILHLFGVR